MEKKLIDKLVDKFLAWPLPESVCSDLCASMPGYPHRCGTNLMTADEAKKMLEHVLGGALDEERLTTTDEESEAYMRGWFDRGRIRCSTAHGDNNMASEYEFRYTAGVLVRKHIRTILESERFIGSNIRWMEEKGWLDSVFRIRGKYADAKAVESRLKAYAKALELGVSPGYSD